MKKANGGVVAMACPQCNGRMDVNDSRPSHFHGQPTIRRRRRCRTCRWAVTTYEVVDMGGAAVAARLPKAMGTMRALRDVLDRFITEYETKKGNDHAASDASDGPDGPHASDLG